MMGFTITIKVISTPYSVLSLLLISICFILPILFKRYSAGKVGKKELLRATESVELLCLIVALICIISSSFLLNEINTLAAWQCAALSLCGVIVGAEIRANLEKK